MKTLIILILTALFYTTAVFASTQQPTTETGLTAAEKTDLTGLQCGSEDYAFLSNGRLIFGNENNKTTQLFIIKNTSNHDIYMDFPEGHVGASAGIGQFIKANQWTGYVFLPGTGTYKVGKAKEQVRQHAAWSCNTANAGCEKFLFVCQVTQAKANGNDLQKQAQAILNQAKTTGWAIYQHIDNDSAKTINEVFADWLQALNRVSISSNK